eukprot:m.191737 g.191737  ORF g.191737 m.191737 type:complete len:58 (+) comp18444_c0_seq1:247-420(+)
MVCPFGFIAASIFFAPRALATAKQLPMWQQAALAIAVVVGGGVVMNRIMFAVLLPDG